MDISLKPKCQVCFFEPFTQTEITQMITCSICRRSAHKFCYLPNFNGKVFTCDGCQKKAKKPICYICGNDGLMKLTSEGDYAHPICLMFNHLTVANSYSSLNFCMQKGKRKSKMGKCNICQNNTQLCDLFKCYETTCQNYGHYYCILKDQGCKNFQQQKWVEDLKILDSNYINYIQLYIEKIKRYIKKASPIFYKSLFGDKKIKEQIPPSIVFCSQHSLNLANCICITLQQSKQERNWVLCDNCGRWYHFQCQQLKDAPNQDNYKCKCCLAWQNKLKSNKIQPILQNFPRLHFYDLVYIQYISQSKGYRVSNSMMQLLKRVPFTCSIKYFNQFIKNKQISHKLIQSINFMNLKKLIKPEGKNKKQAKKNQNQNKGELNSHMWKMDFLISNQPLEAINKAKNLQYKMDEIPNILLKFYKKYNEGSNIIKPLLKQLQQSHQQKQSQSQNQQNNQISDSDVKNSINLLKDLVPSLKRPNTSIKVFQEKGHQFYKLLQSNQLINEVCKNYLEEKRNHYKLAEPIFIYDDNMDMYAHSRLQQLFQTYNNFQQQTNAKQVKFAAKRIIQIYKSASKKVQNNNIHIVRQINSEFINDEKQNIKQIMFQTNNKSQAKKLKFNMVQKFYFMQQNLQQNILQNRMKNYWVSNLLLSLQLNQISINSLYDRYKNYYENIKDQKVIIALKSYVKFYEFAKALAFGITQGLIQQTHNQNTDLFPCIKSVKIDKSNIYKFCTFFIGVCDLSLNMLQPKFNQIIKQKGTQFLNLIASRSMIFQCQIQFKAAAALMNKYNIKLMKISDLLLRHKQLLQMVKSITVQSLQNLTFIDTHLRILQQARQFCLENDLEFRISKIQYMTKLYQCKEEAFKYFPAIYIIKDINLLPQKFAKCVPKSTVDFYLLKKFLYKLKLLKFPTEDHLYSSLNQLYSNRLPYFTKISQIIATYNANLQAQQQNYSTTKFIKKDIINLISQKHKQFITCKPEEQQILILIDEHGKNMKKLQKYIKNKMQDQSEGQKIYKQLMISPFQIQNKYKYDKFFDKMAALLNQKVKKEVEIQHQIEIYDIMQNIPTFLKKTELDQTSAKGQYSNKSLKPIQKLLGDIDLKPRVITVQEICRKYKNMKDCGEIDQISQNFLKNCIEKCRKLQRNYETLLTKYKKGQKWNESDVAPLQRLMQEYEKQNLRMQVVENICSSMRQIDLTKENKQQKSVNSFFSGFSSKNSFRQDQKQIRIEPKTKKVKVILDK